METKSEKQDSIKISRTSRGMYSWEIKLYYDDDTTIGENVIKRLKQLDTTMKESFERRE